MHNYYGMGAEGVVMHKSSARKNIDEAKLVPLAELQELADNIADCCTELQSLPELFHKQVEERRGQEPKL